MKVQAITIALILLLLPLSLAAGWKTLSTDSFMIYHRSGMEDEALHALRVMEYYRNRLERISGNTHPRVAIKLEDMGNLVNGYANPPGNLIGLYMYPPTKGELAYGEDWFQTVATHEYIHQLQMTHEGAIPELLRRSFGNLLYPQLHQPMWMTEGITVYGESQLSSYTGRMNSAYYSSIISALAAEDKLPSRAKAAYYSYDTPLAHYYVFGGSFHNYLAKTYGEERFGQLYRYNSSQIFAYLNGIMPAFCLDSAFYNCYGKTLDQLWQDWQISEKQKASNQPAQRITWDGGEKSDLRIYDESLYYIRRISSKTGPGSGFYTQSLMRIDLTTSDAQPVEVLRQATDFPASYHIQGDDIYFSRSEYRRGFGNKDNDGYGSITEILKKNAKGTELIFRGQVRAFLPLANGDILIGEDLPMYRGSRLFRYSPTSRQQILLYSGDSLIHGIFVDKDQIYVNAKEYWKNSAMYILNGGKLELISDSPTRQTILKVSDGSIVYNTIINDQLQAWEYNLNSKTHQRFQYSHYLKDPAMAKDGKLWFLSINADGLDLYQGHITLQRTTHPKLDSSSAPFPKESYKGQNSVLNGMAVNQGGYLNNIAHLLNPRLLHIPQFYITEDTLQIGAVLVGSDAVGDFPQYQISGIYDAKTEQVQGSFVLSNTLFAPLHQDIMISSDDDGTYMLNQSISLYKRQNYGLTSVNAGLGALAWDKWQRRMLYPFISQAVIWPGGRAGLRNTLYWEDKDYLSSARDRLGWQGQVDLRLRSSKHSEIQSVINAAYDPDADSDDVFWPIRGYDHELQSSQGLSLRNTWYTPIIKVRNGLWNPHIYMEDINLGLFADAAADSKKYEESLQYSYGVELIGEFSLLFNMQLQVGFRVGMNKDQEQFLGFILGM
ncbi:MAG: hypothetical protein PHC57_09185 [Candidatus Cloacimonetes bacterium]|nr:hypothetical protein [Candidatus Cloacimonadota bacterium]